MRFYLLIVALIVSLMGGALTPEAAAADKPNIVILFADDMGYGDAGCFGHPTIRTPHIDRMAVEGLKLTGFSVAVGSCRPSRTSLMTGRYAARIHPTFYMSSGPCEPMPQREFTLPEGLKQAGYVTGMTGKWHLRPSPEDLGFDKNYRVKRDDITTRRSTEAAIEFFRENRDRPFFFYLAYYMPHVPLKASQAFKGKSARGFYGDAIEEIDWSVGQVMKELRDLGIAEKTFVFFTSDNGPWLKKDLEGGTAGLLRGGKGTTWEGGVREPTVAWWPGRIEPGTQTIAFATTMDLYQTVLGLAGVEPPEELIYDGRDMREVLIDGSPDGRDELFLYYYVNTTAPEGSGGERLAGYQIRAARLGKWKAHFITTELQDSPKVEHETPLLFDLQVDPREKFDVAAEHPEVIERIKEAVAAHVAERDAELAKWE
jgi:arylsulfatase A-like enzyme